MIIPLKSFALGLVLLAGAACSGTGTTTSSSTISAIELSPSPCAVGRTDSVQMSAVATLPNGTKETITAVATWSTANSQTATVNPDGVVVGVNVGVTAITAEYQGATGTLDCTVAP